MTRDSEFIELMRRLISIVIVIGGLLALLLAAFPYSAVPGHLVALIGEKSPIVGALVAGLAFFGFLKATLHFRELFDAAFRGVYRLVHVVF